MLAAFLLVVMAGFVALAVDIGYLCVARTELQRSADAAALASAQELLAQSTSRGNWTNDKDFAVRQVALQFAEANPVAHTRPTVDLNFDQSRDGDVLLGELVDWRGDKALDTSRPGAYNAVEVRVARDTQRNGEVALFFAGIFGAKTSAVEARASAAFVTRFSGFRPPLGPNGPENLPILPFAIDEETWNTLLRGDGPDEYAWDNGTQKVNSRSDGRPEANLYPLETGSGGNSGTVDIGSNNSSTPTLRRQIERGVSPKELAFHGGELALDNRGELRLSADPGLKAGAIEGELKSIVGQPRIVPIYRSVTGNGQKAEYTITGFAGICIVSVNLKGNDKGVLIQACPVVTRGGIPAAPGRETSQYIYSPVALVK